MVGPLNNCTIAQKSVVADSERHAIAAYRGHHGCRCKMVSVMPLVLGIEMSYNIELVPEATPGVE